MAIAYGGNLSLGLYIYQRFWNGKWWQYTILRNEWCYTIRKYDRVRT